MGSTNQARARLLLLPLVVLLALAAVGCGSDETDDGASAGDSDVRVAVVTDIGGLNDRGFNALANRGLQRAKAELGVEGRVLISKSAADYVPNLSTAASGGYDLVIANGFLMGEAVATVAGRFPDTSFAIIDFPWEALDGAPENVRGLVFAEHESGYLAGVAAAEATTSGTVSAVGGQAVPAVVAFLAGYRAGVEATRSDATVVEGYSEDFVDQAKCKELALTHLGRGADVVFTAAGGCGLGALQAANERQAWGIGVDNDQSFLGPHILTSATKKVDIAVFETVGDVVEGSFEGGADVLFDVANGGVGFGALSPDAPDGLQETLESVSAQIASGSLQIPRE